MIEAAQHTRDALKEEGLLELVTSLIADGRVPPNLAPVGTQGHSHGSHRSTLRSIPAEFVDCRGYRFVVTGHSLGAGTAALLAMLLRHEPMLGDQVECLAYSPPGWASPSHGVVWAELIWLARNCPWALATAVL